MSTCNEKVEQQAARLPDLVQSFGLGGMTAGLVAMALPLLDGQVAQLVAMPTDELDGLLEQAAQFIGDLQTDVGERGQVNG